MVLVSVMISAVVSFVTLLVLSTYFSVAECLDVYESSVYTPKDKPVTRHHQSFWYTPRLGKRTTEDEEEFKEIPEELLGFAALRRKDNGDYGYSREQRGDINDIIYKFPPFAPRPGRAFHSKELYDHFKSR